MKGELVIVLEQRLAKYCCFIEEPHICDIYNRGFFCHLPADKKSALTKLNFNSELKPMLVAVSDWTEKNIHSHNLMNCLRNCDTVSV